MTRQSPILLGRITDPATLSKVSAIDLGDRVRLQGQIQRPGSVDPTSAEAEALSSARDQLAGFAENPDEVFVPFVHTGEPSLSRLLRVAGATVSIEGPDSGLEVGYHPWTIDADNVPCGSLPRLEGWVDGRVRTNDQTVVDTDLMPFHAVSSKALGYNFNGAATTPTTRTGPGGSVLFFANAQDYLTGYPSWTIALADFYDMAPYFKVGATPRSIVGRRFNAAENLRRWVFGNGLWDIRPSSTANSFLTFTMPKYATPAVPGTPVEVDIGFEALGSWFPLKATDIINITCLRYSAEMAKIRLWVAFAPALGTTSSVVTIDLVARRGSRGCNVVIQSESTKQWGIGYHSAPAGGTDDITIHAHGAGLRRHNDDGDTNRMLIFTAAPNLRDNTNGRLYHDTGTKQIDMAIYGEIGGASASAPDDYASLLVQYMADQDDYPVQVLP